MIKPMKRRKPKTPEEIANKRGKKGYALYLTIEAMDYLQQRATKAGVSPSQLVDEAIEAYIAQIKTK